jgi:hypothetical protein
MQSLIVTILALLLGSNGLIPDYTLGSITGSNTMIQFSIDNSELTIVATTNIEDNSNNYIKHNTSFVIADQLFNEIEHADGSFEFDKNGDQINGKFSLVTANGVSISMDIKYENEILFVNINSANKLELINYMSNKFDVLPSRSVDAHVIINLWNYNEEQHMQTVEISSRNIIRNCNKSVIKIDTNGGILIDSINFMPFGQIPMYVPNTINETFIEYVDRITPDFCAVV